MVVGQEPIHPACFETISVKITMSLYFVSASKADNRQSQSLAANNTIPAPDGKGLDEATGPLMSPKKHNDYFYTCTLKFQVTSLLYVYAETHANIRSIKFTRVFTPPLK